MKNKIFLMPLLSLFLSTPVFAQDAATTTPPAVTPSAPATQEATQEVTPAHIPDLGKNAIYYDLNSLHSVDGLPTNSTPLNLAHISKDEVVDWTVMTITDILTANAGELSKKLEENKSKFTDEGFEDLITFVRTKRITNANLIDNKNISVINAQKPNVVNHAEVQGVYRWLISMPLIISSADPKLASSTDTIDSRRKLMNEMAKNNAEYFLTIQIVRLKESNGTPHNIAIEMITEEKPVPAKTEPEKKP